MVNYRISNKLNKEMHLHFDATSLIVKHFIANAWVQLVQCVLQIVHMVRILWRCQLNLEALGKVYIFLLHLFAIFIYAINGFLQQYVARNHLFFAVVHNLRSWRRSSLVWAARWTSTCLQLAFHHLGLLLVGQIGGWAFSLLQTARWCCDYYFFALIAIVSISLLWWCQGFVLARWGVRLLTVDSGSASYVLVREAELCTSLLSVTYLQRGGR